MIDARSFDLLRQLDYRVYDYKTLNEVKGIGVGEVAKIIGDNLWNVHGLPLSPSSTEVTQAQARKQALTANKKTSAGAAGGPAADTAALLFAKVSCLSQLKSYRCFNCNCLQGIMIDARSIYYASWITEYDVRVQDPE